MQSVPSPWIRFTFNFYLFNQICHLDFSQFENQIQRDNTFYMVQFMDQSLEQRNSNKSLGDVQVPIKETDLINTNATITSLHPRMQAIWGDIWKHTVENSKKNSINASMHRSILICRVCIAGDLMMHLQTHTGEKSHKCDQCAFASSQAGHLRIHLKTHTVEKENICNQCDHACSSNLRTHIKMHSGEKSHKCKQCGFAFTGAGSFYGNIWKHTVEKSQTNATNVSMHPHSRRHLKTHTGKSQGMVEVGEMAADGQADFEVPY